MTFVGRVAKRYAEALYATAMAQGVQARLIDEIGTLSDLLVAHPELTATLDQPRLSEAKRLALLDLLLAELQPAAPSESEAETSPEGGEAQGNEGPLPLTRQVMALLVRRRRLALLAEITQALRDRYDADEGIVQAVATTAVPMLKAERENLRVKLAEHLGAKRVDLECSVNPRIVAGLLVHVEGNVIDATVRTYLDTMRERLKQVKVAEFVDAGLLEPLQQAVDETDAPGAQAPGNTE